MTNEEAIERLNNAKGCPLLYASHIEALNMAIKALEAEPLMVGHWIEHNNSDLGQCMRVLYECSCCRAWLGCEYFVRKSYCPNCGAKMESLGYYADGNKK